MARERRRLTAGAVALAAVIVGGSAVCGPAVAGAAPTGTTHQVGVTVSADRPAPRHVDEQLLGLNHLTPEAAPALVPLHVAWSRIDVSFEESDANGPVYNCTTGAFDPTALDQRVQAARVAGARPQLLVDYTPTCLAGTVAPGRNPNHNPPDVGPDKPKWRQLVEEMAVHEIEDEGVTTFEVWNEPNLATFFWNGTEKQYLTLYDDTATALEAAAQQAHRTIEVGGPALATVLPTPDMRWVRHFLAYVDLHHLPLDFLSWHEYFNSPDTGPQGGAPNGYCFAVRKPDGECDNPDLTPALLTADLADMRHALAGHPDLHPKLWLDEWNVNAGYDPRMDGTYGAAFVAAVLTTAQHGHLNRSDFYDAADDSSIDDFGLLNQQGAAKPDWWTFEFWHELAGRQLRVSVSPPTSTAPRTDELGALASRSTDGTVRVLLYNFSPMGPVGRPGQQLAAHFTRQVTLDVAGLPPGRYQATRQTIDTSGPVTPVSLGTVRGKGATLDLSLPGQSVSLVTLTPGAG